MILANVRVRVEDELSALTVMFDKAIGQSSLLAIYYYVDDLIDLLVPMLVQFLSVLSCIGWAKKTKLLYFVHIFAKY